MTKYTITHAQIDPLDEDIVTAVVRGPQGSFKLRVNKINKTNGRLSVSAIRQALIALYKITARDERILQEALAEVGQIDGEVTEP